MKISVRQIAITGLLGSIAILLGVTPLGFIPVPTPAAHATIMHIPAIIGGVLEGPLVGAFIGLIFGISSFLNATIPVFKDPLVAIVPRFFIGITAYYSYILFLRLFGNNVILSSAGAAVVGTATNTILVLLAAVLRGFFPPEVAASIALVHGIPEIVVASLIVVPVVKGIEVMKRSRVARTAHRTRNKA